MHACNSIKHVLFYFQSYIDDQTPSFEMIDGTPFVTGEISGQPIVARCGEEQ
jgi:hypothetical protein